MEKKNYNRIQMSSIERDSDMSCSDYIGYIQISFHHV